MEKILVEHVTAFPLTAKQREFIEGLWTRALRRPLGELDGFVHEMFSHRNFLIELSSLQASRLIKHLQALAGMQREGRSF